MIHAESEMTPLLLNGPTVRPTAQRPANRWNKEVATIQAPALCGDDHISLHSECILGTFMPDHMTT